MTLSVFGWFLDRFWGISRDLEVFFLHFDTLWAHIFHPAKRPPGWGWFGIRAEMPGAILDGLASEQERAERFWMVSGRFMSAGSPPARLPARPCTRAHPPVSPSVHACVRQPPARWTASPPACPLASPPACLFARRCVRLPACPRGSILMFPFSTHSLNLDAVS